MRGPRRQLGNGRRNFGGIRNRNRMRHNIKSNNRFRRNNNRNFNGQRRRNNNFNNNRRGPQFRRRLGRRRPQKLTTERLDDDLDNYFKRNKGENYKDYLDNELEAYKKDGEKNLEKIKGENNTNNNNDNAKPIVKVEQPKVEEEKKEEQVVEESKNETGKGNKGKKKKK